MKKILYLLLFLPVLGCAQSRYGVEGVPVCWRTPLGVDSSLNRYVLVSTTGQPVQTIVYENANGVVVNVSGGSIRYGYCDCIDTSIDDGAVTWQKLAAPVKDSIRGRKDTTVLVLSSNKVVDFDFADTKRFANVYFVGKGVTDTAQLIFLNPPAPEQFGTVFHMKADSGGVALRFTGSQGANNKNGYFLQPGQRAEIRALYDAVAGFELWEVILVWDSIGGGGNTIYTASDSIRNGDRLVKMASDGSQSFGIGYMPSTLDNIRNGDYGLLLSPNTYGALSFFKKSFGTLATHDIYDEELYSTVLGTSNQVSRFRMGKNRIRFSVSNTTQSDKFWEIDIDSTKFKVSRNISGTLRTYELLPASQYPSTTNNVVNILKFTGNGSASVPSFGTVPNIYNEDGTIGTNRTVTLGGVNGDYLKINGSLNDKRLDFYTTDEGYNTDGDLKVGTYGNGRQSANGSYLFYGGKIYSTGVRSFTGTLSVGSERSLSLGGQSYFYTQVRNNSAGRIAEIRELLDSTGNSYNYLKYKTDGLPTGGRIHISGFAKGNESSGLNLIQSPTPSYLIQTIFYNSSTKFDWLRVDYLDTDTTSNRFSLYNGKYAFANARPSTTSGAISTHIWIGTTPSFLRSQHAVISGTTDGSGDITITFPAAMPDASYTLLVTGEGGTLYHYMTQPATKATGSVKVRMFTTAGSAAASTAYQISYEVKDN